MASGCVRIGPLDDSSLAARKLGEGHAYFVASPGYLARHGAPAPETLGAARCIGLGPRETWTALGVRTKVEPVLVVNDLEVACDAAIADVGVALVPAILCREAVRRGRLRVLFGPGPALRRGVYAVYPSWQFMPASTVPVGSLDRAAGAAQGRG
ncbi:MAG TPA: LysR substrate-binding domain-containing protein [Polyangiaceae bacterium]|nr:LysR substrate-binding domain-containing protein [Polyangiaceae bacterium]